MGPAARRASVHRLAARSAAITAAVASALCACSFLANYDGLSSTDAEVPPFGTKACPSAAFFCDGFESGDISRWNDIESYGVARAKPLVEKTHPFAGKYALHVTQDLKAPPRTKEETSSGTLRLAVKDLSIGSTFAARAYVYLPTELEPNTFLMWIASPKGSLVSLVANGANFFIRDVRDTGSATTDAVPLMRWLCVELIVTVKRAGHVSLLVEGKSALELDTDTLGGTPDVPNFNVPANEFRLGFPHVQGLVGRDAFFDDVAVALFPDGSARSSSIGCE
ncbi:MAG: hypothetical protein NVSMB1_25940 [Polyangiales bacterium]